MELSQKLLPPKNTDNAEVWIAWGDTILSRYGKKDATLVFSKAWQTRGKGGSASSNVGLKQWAKKNLGIDLDMGVFTNIASDTDDVLSSVGSVFKMGGMTMYVIGIVSFIIVALVVWKLAKPEAVGTIIKYAK